MLRATAKVKVNGTSVEYSFPVYENMTEAMNALSKKDILECANSHVRHLSKKAKLRKYKEEREALMK